MFSDERFWNIINWLSPADPETNHIAARQLRQAGTGKWFTEGKTFQNWLSPDYSFLWLYGKRVSPTALDSVDQIIGTILTC